jgi:quercetin dioxygenase-like cupin family protein
LQRADIAGTSLELIFASVEISADQIKPHKLTHLMIGQIIEGNYWLQIEGQPRKTYHPGDTFIIPGGALHEEGAIGKPVKATVAYVNEKGEVLVNPTR